MGQEDRSADDQRSGARGEHRGGADVLRPPNVFVLLQRHRIAEMFDRGVEQLRDEDERNREDDPAPLLGGQPDRETGNDGDERTGAKYPAVPLDDRKVAEARQGAAEAADAARKGKWRPACGQARTSSTPALFTRSALSTVSTM